MTIELEDMRDGLSEALDELIAERDEAVKKSEMDKVTTAEAEMDRIGVVLATVQFALNEEQAINMMPSRRDCWRACRRNGPSGCRRRQKTSTA